MAAVRPVVMVMSKKVLPLNNVTLLDLPPDRILEQAKGKLEGVVLMGFDEEGEFYGASSYADGGTVLWLVELLKQELFDAAGEVDI